MIIEKLMEEAKVVEGNEGSKIIKEMFRILGWGDKHPSYLLEWEDRFDKGIDNAVSRMDTKTKEAFIAAINKYPNLGGEEN